MHGRTVSVVLAAVLGPPWAAGTQAEPPPSAAPVVETGAIRGTGSQSTPVAAPADPQPHEPWFTLRKAQLLGAAAGLAIGVAFAQQPDAPITPMRRLRGIDAVLTGSAAALYLGAGIFHRDPPAAGQGTGSTEPAPTPPNRFDRKIRNFAIRNRSLENRRFLDHLSSATLMTTVFQPLGLLSATGAPRRWTRDVPIMAEAMVLTLSVNAFVKHLSHRSRPDSYRCGEDATDPCTHNARLSFYSGHTSSAFAAAVSAGSIADFHRLRNRKWIWASQLTLAATTGALRVMSDQHYATDVVTGMAAGTLAGWLIPRLHKPGRGASPSPATSAAPAAALPLVFRPGNSAALVTAGFAGGGPYVRVHWQW